MSKKMGGRKVVLIVCRAEEDLRFISNVKFSADIDYIVASDDVSVHRSIDAYISAPAGVCWLEKTESFYNVANDVIERLDVVNQWLRSLCRNGSKFNKDLVFWVRHCEGGVTTQRIQDSLLMIRSYVHLIDEHMVTNIIIIRNHLYDYEDKVFIQTARSKGVTATILGKSKWSNIVGCARLFLEDYARAAYYYFNILRRKVSVRLKGKRRRGSSREIVFQLFSSAYKHVENVLPLMAEMRRRNYDPVALCWSSSEKYCRSNGASVVRRNNLRADELEGWLSFSDIIRTPYQILSLWIDALRARDVFFDNEQLSYYGVPLGELLWTGVRRFIVADLLLRQHQYLALKEYFRGRTPLAIKYWGNGVLAEGAISADLLSSADTFVFDYFLGLNNDNPYAAEGRNKCDLFLASNRAERESVIRDLGIGPEKVIEIGKSRYDHLLNSFSTIHRHESLTKLGIKAEYRRYVMYDPGCVMRGYDSMPECGQRAVVMFEYAKRDPNVAIIIKPHPGGSCSMVRRLMKKYALNNVYIIDKGEAPYHAINSSDIVITKMSTIGIEAMILERPVVSVILDGEKRFRVFGDAVEYCDSKDGLLRLLESILGNEEIFTAWSRERLARQREYCSEHVLCRGGNATERAADALCGGILSRGICS